MTELLDRILDCGIKFRILQGNIRTMRKAYRFNGYLVGLALLCMQATALGAVGRIEGAGSVTSSGAASYEIPLRLPPGTAGIEPELSITYNSQRGNGILGPGWALSGVPSITRCNRSVAQDGAPAAVTLTYADAFCLDSKRLRITNGTLANYGQPGTTYDTEIAEFSRITASGIAGNGPASFELRAKNGLIYEFGATADSRITPSPSITTAYVWLLNKVRNRSNTSYSISYGTGAAGSVGIGVPLSISYAPVSAGAGTYNNTITFVYGPKAAQVPGTTDPAVVGYVAGLRVVNTNLLIGINATVSGTLTHRYVLGYEAGPSTRARLASITECGGSAGTDCLAPTTISYQNGAAGVSTSSITAVSGNVTYLASPDLNGDGRNDIVYLSGVTVYAVLTTASGLSSPVMIASSAATSLFAYGDVAGTTRADVLIPQVSGYTRYSWNGTGFSATPTGIPLPANIMKAALLDVDGDGRVDLVMTTKTISSSQDTYTVLLRLNTSTAGVASFSGTQSTAYSALVPCNPPPGRVCSLEVLTGTESRSGVQNLDFNGDNRKDLMLRIVQPEDTGPEFYLRYLISNGTGFTAPMSDEYGVEPPSFALWNDDACTDLVYTTGSVSISSCNSSGASGVNLGATALTTLDWNGDGHTDALVQNGANFGVMQSTGTGTTTLIPTSVPVAPLPKNAFVFDYDGDGQHDLGTWSTSGIIFYPHNSPGAPPDLATSITDGYGIQFNPSYASIAQGNYEKGTDAVYPERDYIAPMYVVSSFSASTGASAPGAASTFTQSFAYYRARAQVQGRGFEGFEAKRTQDSRNGLYVYEYFNRSFPYSGTSRQIDVVQPNNVTLISRAVNTWTAHNYGSAPETRSLPYIGSTVTQQYEVGGAFDGVLIRSSSTSNVVDFSTGTRFDSTTTVTEGSNANGLNPGASHSLRTYSPTLFNDFTNWCFGRPTSTQQINSHGLLGGSQQTRTINATWDGFYCRPTQTAIEPDNPTRQVTTDLGYDGFGNLATQSVTPIGETARLTQLDWGTDGRFPRTLTNPLSQVTTLTWWEEWGLLRTATDPNGQVASNFYDNFGRLITQVQPDTTSTLIEYLTCDSDCSGVAGSKYKIRNTLRDTAAATIAQGFTVVDAFDRPRRSSSYALEGGLINQLIEYDALGRVARTSTPYFNLAGTPVWTSFTYDVVGRQRQATRDRTSDIDASEASSATQFEGLSITSTDPLGKVRVATLDPLGQIVRAIQASGTVDQATTSYNYDAFGSLVRTTDGFGNQINLGYDVRGFKVSSSDPDLGDWTYDYYALGELKTQTDAKSQITTLTYDKLSRPLTRVEPSDSGSGTQTTFFTWGSSAASFNIGQLQSVVVGSYSESYSYDNRARLSSTTVVADGGTYVLSQSYNPTTGLLETLTYPASTGASPFKVKYEFDTASRSGLLKRITDFDVGTVFWQATSSNALGQYQDITLGNGLKTLTAFDSITGVTNRIETGPAGGNTLQSLQYAWDKIGNVTSRQDLNIGKTETFAYDNLYRMTQAQVSGATALNVSYDQIGNITSKSDLGSYSYHPTKKHAVTTAGLLSITYDANGNVATQTNPTGTATVSWTAYNLPKLISSSSGRSSQFLYGADRQRYKHVAVASGVTETTIYIKGLFEKVVRPPFGTEYRHLIQGPEGIIAIHNRKSSGVNETNYLLKDHLGSTDVITNQAGASVVKLSFSAFGARRKGSTWSGSPTSADQIAIAGTSRLAFTGHEQLDHLDLVHMNGRVYQPLTGRFISADPFVQAPFNSQSLNRYSYVFNNPLSLTDPSGFGANGINSGVDGDPGRGARDAENFFRNAAFYGFFNIDGPGRVTPRYCQGTCTPINSMIVQPTGSPTGPSQVVVTVTAPVAGVDGGSTVGGISFGERFGFFINDVLTDCARPEQAGDPGCFIFELPGNLLDTLIGVGDSGNRLVGNLETGRPLVSTLQDGVDFLNILSIAAIPVTGGGSGAVRSTVVADAVGAAGTAKFTVRRFMSRDELKLIKKSGLKFDPARGDGIPTTTRNFNPRNQDIARRRTGANALDVQVDFDVSDLARGPTRNTKGGLPEYPIRGDLTSDRIIPGTVRKVPK
jgi:RHS repeat-associated protein